MKLAWESGLVEIALPAVHSVAGIKKIMLNDFSRHDEEHTVHQRTVCKLIRNHDQLFRISLLIKQKGSFVRIIQYDDCLPAHQCFRQIPTNEMLHKAHIRIAD